MNLEQRVEEMSYTYMMEGQRIARLDSLRANEILSRPANESGIWYYDPQAEEPLLEPNEKCMEQMGPAAYLHWLLREYKMEINIAPKTEHECRRTARVVVRAIKGYTGEKFIQ